MRSAFFASILLFAACQKAGSGDDTITPDSPADSGNLAFSVTSTDVSIPGLNAGGNEVTYCFYFHTPNTTPVAINKWVSDMSPGSHHMIFFTGGPDHADGLDTSNSCGLGGSVQNVAKWVYATQTPHQEENLPPDDGGGKPLAQLIQPGTLGAMQMHYVNTNDDPINVHVTLSAYKLADGAAYTQTDAYITYNNDITIGPGATNVAVTATCNAPANVKFWTMSTHAHKQAIKTDVMDGATNIFHSDDWEHPGAQVWGATPFYTFASNKVSWTCTYDNTGDNKLSTIKAGPSAQTNEMCMATGYFFPATGAMACVVFGGQCYCQ